MTYIKHKLVMLPTNDKANLCFVVNTETSTLTLFEDAMEKHKRFFPQHLYITSDEKIKKGDWYILLPEQQIKQAQKDLPTHRDWKKIIATTDKELEIIHRQLYPNGDYTGVANLIPLPQIPESFIEYFVSEYNQGREITSVLVEYEEYCEHGTFPVLYNKPKQVIERGAGGHICSGTNRLKINSNNTINIKPIKDSWTREEILNDIEQAMIQGLDIGQYRDKWI